jgi:membrane protein DedA with SNARE-associated domain
MFSGRLLPGVKHFISFPAGLGKMNLKLFTLYTALGGALWCGVLIWVGYLIGENEDLIAKYIRQVNFILFVSVVCLVSFYIWKKKISPNQEL